MLYYVRRITVLFRKRIKAMNEIIRKRKSVRKYEKTQLDEAILTGVREQIKRLTPLYPDIRYSIDIAEKTKGLINDVTAPHYLVFYSEEKAGAYENIGFVGQQMDLFLSENGIGSCWLGFARPNEKSEKTYVISMAFGKPAEPLHRSLTEFKRKPLSQISEGVDMRLEAARLAPSGMNAQGWFFEALDGKIRCYCKKPRVVPEKFGRIDLGIALWHIASESDNFSFVTEPETPERKGYIFAGTVSAG